ncbi:hypothetical protein ACS0TY_031896 [Phlomoides rotata]
MGRPPCCDKVGIKKGPWTPEEDIILVSYIQENGPGNWSSVPTNTGLLRCSKSCRLRWTNYLRPGIKRGNFTPHEEGMIVHLQALMGNKWAAIATYLPQRTDNDIKNYWNTHLKKKLKKLQSLADSQKAIYETNNTINVHESSSSMHGSSAENISRLMENWMRSSSSFQPIATSSNLDVNFGKIPDELFSDYRPMGIDHHGENIGIRGGDLERFSSFDHHRWIDEKMTSCEGSGVADQENVYDEKMKIENDPPLSFLEKWLFDENASPHMF